MRSTPCTLPRIGPDRKEVQGVMYLVKLELNRDFFSTSYPTVLVVVTGHVRIKSSTRANIAGRIFGNLKKEAPPPKHVVVATLLSS